MFQLSSVAFSSVRAVAKAAVRFGQQPVIETTPTVGDVFTQINTQNRLALVKIIPQGEGKGVFVPLLSDKDNVKNTEGRWHSVVKSLAIVAESGEFKKTSHIENICLKLGIPLV
ncbi:MAG: hypothetical protein U0003_03090 [Vampirovibrionales bacterium]